MRIIELPENEQITLVGEYNQNKKSSEQIPLMSRNLTSGWPLLQVSLYSAAKTNDGSVRYEGVLGGGKCHFFFIGAFNLTCLISKVPGKIAINEERSSGPMDIKLLRIDNVECFLDSFDVHHKSMGMRIASKSGGYGKTLNVTVPEGNANALERALHDIFLFAFQTNKQLRDVFLHGDQGYTAERIQSSINDNVAIFSSGQIFIDLGAFLKQAVRDQEITAFFSNVFKVEEFKRLTDDHPELSRLNPSEWNYNGFDELNLNIDIMRQYGASLKGSISDEIKGNKIVTLAEKLQIKARALFEATHLKQTTPKDVEQLKSEFTTLLHSEDEMLKSHRTIWKPIIANIALALTGIGLVVLLVKVLSHAVLCIKKNEKVLINDSLFFAKTTSQKKTDDVDEAIHLVTSLPRRPS